MNSNDKPYELKKDGNQTLIKIFSDSVNPHFILESLGKEGFSVSFQQVENLIKSGAGEWIQLTERDPDEIEIRISIDRMKTEIKFNSSDPPDPETHDKIKTKLEKAGVVKGINSEILERSTDISTGKTSEWIVIASGKAPVDGIDASLEISVATEQRGPLNSDTAAQVDLKNLGIIHNIQKGSIIAKKIPLKEGIDGFDVMGKTLKAKKAKDILIKPGTNTELSEDGLELFATANGQLLRDKNKFSVEELFSVNGDIDYGTGNLDFLGSITISGSVKEDFSVNANEKLEISGVVEGAHLSSGKDMVIKSGVRGMGKGFIKCGGDLHVEYMDQCNTIVKRDLFFKRGLMHCDIETEGAIKLVEGGKGVIAGGNLKAGTEIECSVLGTKMGTKTSLQVGLSPELTKKKVDLIQNLEKLKGRNKTLEKNLVYLSKIMKDTGLTEKQKLLANEYGKLHSQLFGKIEKIESYINEIEKVIDAAKKRGRVKVRGICYPGVKVTIRKETFIVRDVLEKVCFISEDGSVKIISL